YPLRLSQLMLFSRTILYRLLLRFQRLLGLAHISVSTLVTAVVSSSTPSRSPGLYPVRLMFLLVVSSAVFRLVTTGSRVRLFTVSRLTSRAVQLTQPLARAPETRQD